eukprot:SAG11_NODE_1019_length_6159_cov_23.425248_4_plen_79_part_00
MSEKVFEVISNITSKLQMALERIDELSEEIMKLRESSLEVLFEIAGTTDYSELSPDGQELYDEYEDLINQKCNSKATP